MRFILQLQQMRAVFYFYFFIFFVESEGTYDFILLCFSDFISFGPTL